MTMRLQHADRIKGREVLVSREVEKGWANRGFIAVFEAGEFVEAASIAGLVGQLSALGIRADQVRAEINGDCALSDVARDELFDRMGGNDVIPKFL
jgi:hypothetical protein